MRILSCLIMLALLVRALVPTGFMPEFTADKIAITICHGADVKTVFVPKDGGPVQHEKSQTVCPFTPLSTTAPVLLAPLWHAFLLIAFTVLLYELASQVLKQSRFRRSSFARAPPV